MTGVPMGSTGGLDAVGPEVKLLSSPPVIPSVPRLKLMHPVDPYIPPVADATTATKKQASAVRFEWLTPFAFIALPLLLGIAGFAGYIALAFALEVVPAETEPVLSHGQQAILISLPICTLIGASVGGALAFLFARQPLICACLLFAIAIAGYGITRSLWNAQIAQYGRDASEVVLYWSPAGYSALSATLAILVACTTILTRTWRGTMKCT